MSDLILPNQPERMLIAELHLIRDMNWNHRVVLRAGMPEEEILKIATDLAFGIVAKHHIEWENARATGE